MTQENTLPTVEDIRELLATGKQYFDNEYHPSDFVNPYVEEESEAEMERRTR